LKAQILKNNYQRQRFAPPFAIIVTIRNPFRQTEGNLRINKFISFYPSVLRRPRRRWKFGGYFPSRTTCTLASATAPPTNTVLTFLWWDFCCSFGRLNVSFNKHLRLPAR